MFDDDLRRPFRWFKCSVCNLHQQAERAMMQHYDLEHEKHLSLPGFILHYNICFISVLIGL